MSSNATQSDTSVNQRAPMRWSAVLAVCLAIELGGLLAYGVVAWHRETDPQRIAQRAEHVFVANYPELRTGLLAQTSRHAPTVAEQFSDELLQATIQARADFEAFSVDQLERGLDNAVELSADEFREWLHNNHAAIEDAFVQIEQAPTDARLLMLDTEASLEEQLGLDLRDQARLALEVYRLFNDKLARLANTDNNLSQQEQLERRMIRLLRAMAR